MKTLADPGGALAAGLADIRREFQVPAGFPADVLAAAETAVRRVPDDHVDRTAMRFVTLDPASAVDLDQAFAIETSGADLLLHYAIADVGWFVRHGDSLDREAWERGTTTYLPDGKAGLYPPILSEGAASLLPSGPRPAVVITVRIDPAGLARVEGVERAIIRSAAKLAYEDVRSVDLPPGFADLSARIAAAEIARGAARVDPPEQQVEPDEAGGYALAFRPRLQSEADNAALSLAANLAIADLLHSHDTGLFRVMAEPGKGDIARLRQTAKAFRLNWPDGQPLTAFETALDPANPAQASMMLAIRRSGHGASYAAFDADEEPWHAAVAARYAHATAPLRRLADRYVLSAALAVASGRPVAAEVEQAFAALPKIMARADARDGQISRAVIDLAEAVMLSNAVGTDFAATAVDSDDRGSRIQLDALPIVARVREPGLTPGQAVRVRVTAVDMAKRRVSFSLP